MVQNFRWKAIYLAEGDFAVHAVHTHQYHARHPEEDDVKVGNEDVAGVEVAQVGGLFRPALGGKRPVVWIASNANTARNKPLSAIKNRRQAGFLSQVR